MKLLTDSEIAALAFNHRAITNTGVLLVAADELIRAAERLGLMLTIEQRSLRPLAMGNYETVVGVREARAGA